MKKKVFWKIYGVLGVIGVALSVTLLIVFWNFLSAYEKSQPKYEMEKVINLFEDSDSTQLVKYYQGPLLLCRHFQMLTTDRSYILQAAKNHHLQIS